MSEKIDENDVIRGKCHLSETSKYDVNTDLESMVSLPGQSNTTDFDDPIAAAKQATQDAALVTSASQRKAKQLRSKSKKPAKIRSKSHKGSGGGTRSSGSSREHGSSKSSGSLRSASERPGKSLRSASSRQPKAKVGSKSVREKRSSSSAKPEIKLASEGGRRRTAIQHNLKDMKDLHKSKDEAESSGEGNRRGESIVACRALFDRIDVDASGTLDRKEISMLATKMGRGLKADELDAAMSAMDIDGNGTVDFDEFCESRGNPHTQQHAACLFAVWPRR